MYGDKVQIIRHPDSNAIRKLHVDLKFLNKNKYIIICNIKHLNNYNASKNIFRTWNILLAK